MPDTNAERLDGFERFVEQIQDITEKSRRVTEQLLARKPETLHLGMADPSSVGQAFVQLATRLLADPGVVTNAQFNLAMETASLWQKSVERLMLGDAGHESGVQSDKRFKHSDWTTNLSFSFIRESYLIAAKSILSTVRSVEGLDDSTAHKVDFYTRQFVDALSPSNFAVMNPEVIEKTVETRGQNLLDGLRNMVSDLDRGQGQLSIAMADVEAFRLGENIAATPGKVIFQNEMMQLIQYDPSTTKVRKRPLLIVPPWINKFYVLDLQPKNSLIKWAVDQGHTVFVISWVNPDERHAHKSFEDYMLEGPLAALDAVEAATGERSVNVAGYCLGGTLLASTLAYMAARDDDRIASATYFVTLVDFAEAGDMAVFVDDEQLTALEKRMEERGYLEARDMSTSFNMLRANDLIWSFVISNYMLGKDKLPFDLLFWNSDATRMPATMQSFYLRNMYQKNLLSQPDGIALGGTPIDLTRIKTPTFILATREDHIAPWKSTYAATHLYSGPIKFVLSAAGHMAGVVSAPGSKYGHWTNDSLPPSPDDWFTAAEEHSGSWWPLWNEWVTSFEGGRVPARAPGDGKLPVIEDAPGSYVRVRSNP